MAPLLPALIMTIAATTVGISSLAKESDAFPHPSAIGTPGKPWGADEYVRWRDTRPKQRCYFDLVPRITALGDVKCEETNANLFEVVKYGDLPHHGGDEGATFPLYAVRSSNWCPNKRNVFVTGGVHGYETSGVEGAMLFVSGGAASRYSRHFSESSDICPQ